MKTRDQAIVAAISGQDVLLREVKASRYTVSLSGMLLRHGLLQTIAFLQRKAAADNEQVDKGNNALMVLLAAGVNAVGGAGVKLAEPSALKQLAGLPLSAYLHIQESAVATATWIKRLVEAQTAIDEDAAAAQGRAP